MTAVADVVDELTRTREAIRAWRLPQSLLDASNLDERAEEVWTRLHASVVANCEEGFAAVMVQLSRRDADGADETLGLVQRRWASWLRQVRDAERDPMQVSPSLTARANALVQSYYDAVERGVEAARRLPEALTSGAQTLGLVLVGAGALYLMSQRRR